MKFQSKVIRVRRLTLKVCDQVISDEEFVLLNEFLKDKELRLVYLQMMNLHFALVDKFSKDSGGLKVNIEEIINENPKNKEPVKFSFTRLLAYAASISLAGTLILQGMLP